MGKPVSVFIHGLSFVAGGLAAIVAMFGLWYFGEKSAENRLSVVISQQEQTITGLRSDIEKMKSSQDERIATAEDKAYRLGVMHAESNERAVDEPLVEFFERLNSLLGSQAVVDRLGKEFSQQLSRSFESVEGGDYDSAISGLPDPPKATEAPGCMTLDKQVVYEIPRHVPYGICDTDIFVEYVEPTSQNQVIIAFNGARVGHNYNQDKYIGRSEIKIMPLKPLSANVTMLKFRIFKDPR